MQNSFYDLPVLKKAAKTDDATVIYLDRPAGAAFEFTAGQYITLKLDLDGQEERRAYSLCTSPDDNEFGFCVKRLDGGKVSNYLLDKLSEGDTLAMMPPEGRFVAKTDAAQRKTYFLIGAGSGITPLMSIARTVLESEPGSAVHLLYGNRSEATIIFRDELNDMERRYDGQFTVSHILSQPERKKAGGLSGLFGKSKPTWTGRMGRIDPRELNLFLADHEARTPVSEYYICGPGGMIDTVEKDLLRRGMDDKHIHTERFLVEEVSDENKIHGSAEGLVRVTLDGAEIEIQVDPDKTILETLVAAGHNPPYSCTSGACSTCIAKVTEGEVKMDVNHALDPDEVKEGYCLTCQSHPVTPSVALSYDE